MAPIKLSFGPAKALPKKPILAKKAFKPTSLSLSDDESPLASTSTSTTSRPGSGGIKVSTASLSRAQRKKMAEEVEMNKEVYAYDEVWDNMKEGDRKAKAERMKDDGERKVCLLTLFMGMGLIGGCSPSIYPN
jgi:coiled-coil domain-containing protein 55